MPYDALLDDYEPDAKTADVASVLAGLREELVPLVAGDQRAGRKRPDVEILQRQLSAQPRRKRSAKRRRRRSASTFSRGRLDVTHHPFCTRPGSARLPHHHALRRAFFQLRRFSASCTRRATASTTRGCGRALRPAAGDVRVAGHSRVAIADVGEPRRPQPGVLASISFRSAKRRFPRRWATCRSTTSTLRSTTCGRR